MLGLVITGCAGKYDNVKKINASFAKATQTYADNLDKADSAKAVAKAMNSYADKLESIWPDMQTGREVP